MKKKLIILFSTLVVLGVAFFSIWNLSSDYSKILQANWDFEIPNEAKYSQSYTKDSGTSFNGDGIRYHIFKYENEEYIENLFAWMSEEKATIFNTSFSEATTSWLKEIEVPVEYHPNFTNCLYWYQAQEDNSELIVCWDKDTKSLYIIESFM